MILHTHQYCFQQYSHLKHTLSFFLPQPWMALCLSSQDQPLIYFSMEPCLEADMLVHICVCTHTHFPSPLFPSQSCSVQVTSCEHLLRTGPGGQGDEGQTPSLSMRHPNLVGRQTATQVPWWVVSPRDHPHTPWGMSFRRLYTPGICICRVPHIPPKYGLGSNKRKRAKDLQVQQQRFLLVNCC